VNESGLHLTHAAVGQTTSIGALRRAMAMLAAAIATGERVAPLR
jgi:hypothetical protein